LVGARPVPVREYEGFDIDWHRRRFTIRPGITCPWQINGRRNLSFEKWKELDMKYMGSCPLVFDFKILLKPISAVLKGCGWA
jgi:lipopolysaccharide/colanic/teichoic acid biosynthesis glycosyltransferase